MSQQDQRSIDMHLSQATILTEQDFLFPEWQALVSQCTDHLQMEKVFHSAVKESLAKKDPRTRTLALCVLAAMCSYFLTEEVAQPFGAQMEFSSGRTPIPDDIPAEALKALQPSVENINNPELRARVADTCWVRLRDYKAGINAVQAYLLSAESLCNVGDRLDAVYRVRRASQLTLQLNRDVAPVVEAANRMFEVFPLEEPGSSTLLGKILLSLGVSNLAERFRARAEEYETRGNFHTARGYWALLVSVLLREKDPETSKEAQVRAAESYVLEARSKETQPLVAKHFLEKAIEAYRAIGGFNERVEQMKTWLIELGRKGVQEMLPIRESVDGSELMLAAKSAVADCATLDEAILRLAACLFRWLPKRDATVKVATEMSKKYVFSRLMPTTVLYSDGRNKVKRSSALEAEDEARSAEIFQSLKVSLQVFSAAVWAAREEVYANFRPLASQLSDLLYLSPAVPVGREQLLAQGLLLGFHYKDVQAAHFLLPQLENCLRYILEQSGVITSRLDKDLIQDSYLLNDLLYMPELEQILGPDLTFVLKGVLVERFGFNYRNELLHGLVNPQAASDACSVSVWALTFMICLFPVIQLGQTVNDCNEAASPEPGPDVGQNQSSCSPDTHLKESEDATPTGA